MTKKINWKEVLGVGGVVAIFHGTLESIIQHLTDHLGKKLEKSFQEYRTEMWSFVLTELYAEDEKASKVLQRRQARRQGCDPRTYADKDPYLPGDEDFMMNMLGSAYMFLSENKELASRMSLFQALGRMSDQQFDKTLEAFHNDKVKQFFARISRVGKEAIKTAGKGLNEGATAVAQELHSLNDWLDSKGVR